MPKSFSGSSLRLNLLIQEKKKKKEKKEKRRKKQSPSLTKHGLSGPFSHAEAPPALKPASLL